VHHYVYRFSDKEGNVIYVGKASDLKKRIENEHFNNCGHLPVDCYISTKKIEYIELNNHTQSRIYELYYINKFSPEYNVANNNKEDELNGIVLTELEWKLYTREKKDGARQRDASNIDIVRARLRPDKDNDIRMALEGLPKYVNPSDVIREALRQYFFGGNRANNFTPNKTEEY
jgi:hypothetical protein